MSQQPSSRSHFVQGLDPRPGPDQVKLCPATVGASNDGRRYRDAEAGPRRPYAIVQGPPAQAPTPPAQAPRPPSSRPPGPQPRTPGPQPRPPR